MPKVSVLGNLWDSLMGRVGSQADELRARGESRMPETGLLGEGRGTSRDYLDPIEKAELDRLVADRFQLKSMRSQGYSPEYASGLLKFGEEGMAQEARMARAAEQGFKTDEPLYHWTQSDFRNLMPSERGKIGRGAYASHIPEYGAKYSAEEGRNVMPLYYRGELAKPEDVAKAKAQATSEMKAKYDKEIPTLEWKNRISDILEEQGFSGMRARHAYGLDETVIFDPEKNMRSINATFDPDAPPSLLASRPEAAVGAAAALAEDQGATYGDILPLKRTAEGDIEFAVPGLLRNVLRGILEAEKGVKSGNDERAIRGLLDAMM
jgi:hypothetical protein